MKAFELELQRLTIQLALWELLCFAVAMYVLYLVIRYAIRDGIRESGLLDVMSKRNMRDRPAWARTQPPDMRAD